MSSELFNLSGRVAVVTGGTSGIGRMMALNLAQAGADVVATGRRENLVDEVAADIEKAGSKTLRQTTDAAKRESIDALRDAVVKQFGRVDILINAAGQIFRKPTVTISETEWNNLIDVNLTGTLRACQSFYEPLAASGHGRVINIASLNSFVSLLEVTAYAASKSGVLGLTRSLAVEWAPKGVNVNAIAPGVFRTELNSGLLDGTDRGRELLARTPMKRFGKIPELAGTAIFLKLSRRGEFHYRPVHCGGRWIPGFGRELLAATSAVTCGGLRGPCDKPIGVYCLHLAICDDLSAVDEHIFYVSRLAGVNHLRVQIFGQGHVVRFASETAMISARLPSSSDPICRSIPSARAPPMVAISNTCSAGSTVGSMRVTFCSLAARSISRNKSAASLLPAKPSVLRPTFKPALNISSRAQYRQPSWCCSKGNAQSRYYVCAEFQCHDRPDKWRGPLTLVRPRTPSFSSTCTGVKFRFVSASSRSRAISAK